MPGAKFFPGYEKCRTNIEKGQAGWDRQVFTTLKEGTKIRVGPGISKLAGPVQDSSGYRISSPTLYTTQIIISMH